MISNSQKHKVSLLFLAAVLAIPLCYIADNFIDIEYAISTQKLSVLYFFFGSYTFAGQFGVYITSMLYVLPLSYILRHIHAQYTKTSCIRFVGLSSLSGLTALCGTGCFFIMLNLLLPFSTSDFVTGIATVPYIHYIRAGDSYVYIAISLLMSFLKGMIGGSIAQIVSLRYKTASAIILFPPLIRFFLRQFERIMLVPANLRIECWLGMESIWLSEGTTIMLCVFITLTATLLLWLASRHCLRERKNKKAYVQRYTLDVLVVMVIVLTYCSALVRPWIRYASYYNTHVDFYLYPLLLNDPLVQNALQLGFVAIVVMTITYHAKETAWKQLGGVFIHAVIFSTVVMLFICTLCVVSGAQYENTSFWIEFRNSILSKPQDIVQYIIPDDSILVRFSMADSIVLQYLLQTLVYIYLGLLILVFDALSRGYAGSIIALSAILMNITAYNLLGIDCFRWILCSLAQLSLYSVYNEQYGLTTAISFNSLICQISVFAAVLLICRIVKKAKSRR